MGKQIGITLFGFEAFFCLVILIRMNLSLLKKKRLIGLFITSMVVDVRYLSITLSWPEPKLALGLITYIGSYWRSGPLLVGPTAWHSPSYWVLIVKRLNDVGPRGSRIHLSGRSCCEQDQMLLGLACRQGLTQPWVWLRS
jgi:hypothetical protein